MTSEHVVFLGWVPHCLHEGPVFKLALLHPLIMSQSTSESSKVRNLIHSYSLHTPTTLWGTLSIANHMAATEHTYMKAKSKLPQQGRSEVWSDSKLGCWCQTGCRSECSTNCCQLLWICWIHFGENQKMPCCCLTGSEVRVSRVEKGNSESLQTTVSVKPHSSVNFYTLCGHSH